MDDTRELKYQVVYQTEDGSILDTVNEKVNIWVEADSYICLLYTSCQIGDYQSGRNKKFRCTVDCSTTMERTAWRNRMGTYWYPYTYVALEQGKISNRIVGFYLQLTEFLELFSVINNTERALPRYGIWQYPFFFTY